MELIKRINSNLKIFELTWTSTGEKSWIAANTIIQAIQIYCSVVIFTLEDFDGDEEIKELPKEHWGKMTVTNNDFDANSVEDNWKTKTFKQWMEENDEPDVIASTMENDNEED
jgi:hypothetical protein